MKDIRLDEPASRPDRDIWPYAPSLLLIALGAASAGVAVGIGGTQAAGMVIALALGAAIYAAPQIGAYLWLALGPLIVGIERGDLVPFVRPNEALLILILAAAGLRIVPAMIGGRWLVPIPGRIDLALAFLILTGSLLPILMQYGRNRPVTTDDILYSFVLVKYLLVFLLFRTTIRTDAQVRSCLILAVAAALPVSIIALLQVNGLFGVPVFLATYYDQPFSGSSGPIDTRGTSTIASSFGVANVMAMVASVVFVWWLKHGTRGWLLIGVGTICLLGVVAAGQFSGFLGIILTIGATGLIVGRLRRLAIYVIPVLVVAGGLLWPVLENRLAGFERHSGLPQSWEGRIDNIERFVLPDLVEDANWLLGVRPAPRIAAPEQWRDWVYIESGYIWLLWIGGIPFLIGYLTFAWIGLRDLTRIGRQRHDMTGVAAVAAGAALASMAVLMVFDPHLTMRGGADLFFALLALALTGAYARPGSRE